MPSFLVEGYVPRPTPAALESLSRRARRLEAHSGVEYVGSLVLPSDEVCFHVFRSASLSLVLAATERSGLPHERVIDAVWLPRAP